MSCNCLEMLHEKLVERTGDTKVSLDLVAAMDDKGGSWLRPEPLRLPIESARRTGVSR